MEGINKSSASHENKLCPFLPTISYFPLDKRTIEAKSFNLTFRYINDVLPVDNPDFVNWIPYYAMYPQKPMVNFLPDSMTKAFLKHYRLPSTELSS